MPVDPSVSSPIDRKTLSDLVPLVVALVLFALLGGTTRLLVRWEPIEPWQRRIGGVLGSIVAALLVGLPLADHPWFHDRVGVLLALAGTASWAGAELVDRIVRRVETIADRYLKERGK